MKITELKNGKKYTTLSSIVMLEGEKFEIQTGGKFKSKECVPTKFINAEFEECVEKKTIYNLGIGDNYYYIADDTCILSKKIDLAVNIEYYKERLSIGNVFLTREDVEFELECRKVRAKMMIYSDDKEWDGNEKHWYILYDNCNKKIKFHFAIGNITSAIYFSSKEQAELCVREVEEERIIKYYFKIK